MIGKLLVCLFVSASALNIGVSRRAALAKIAAPAFAERNLMTAAIAAPWMDAASSNTVLGVAKATKPGPEPVGITEAIGRPGAKTAEYGAALPESAKYSTSEYANKPLVVGSQPVPKSAMDRLMAR